MAENTTSNKDRLKEITDGIEQGIQELFTSEKYMQYLRTMSRFHKYSVNNTMLIYMQRPDATAVAGFNKWKNQFGRNVMKGEKGIKIIAPTPFKKKIEEQKLDPDTKLPVLDAEGKAIMEEKEVKIPMYKVVSVFDVAQTAGKSLPTLASDLAGNVQNYDVFMEALRRSAPVPISVEAMKTDMDGFFSAEAGRIAIREGMSEVQTVSATVHEITHSKLHNKELPEVKDQWKPVMVSDGGTKKDFSGGFDTREEAEAAGEAQGWRHVDENAFEWRLEVEEDTFTADFVKKTRNTEEVEAESVSYAVCAYYGIPTGENSFGYIATWSKGKELTELRASLETINKTASGLITDIDRNYAEIMKERGLNKAEPEQTAEQAVSAVPTPEYEYKLHANPRSTSDRDAALIQAYERKDGDLHPDKVLGFGAYADFIPLTNKLNDEKTALDAAIVLVDECAYEPPLGGEITGVSIETYDPNAAAPELEQDYPMPDPALTIEDMHSYGYTDGDMLPLTRERAIELQEKDLTVFMLYSGNGAGMAFDRDDLEAHNGMFAITREEWEDSRDYLSSVDGESISQTELERAFLDNPIDAFAIYQLKHTDETRGFRFEPLERLEAAGLSVERGNYELIYTAPLPQNDDFAAYDHLNALYEQFNISHPEDFKGHSLSVSDIVALKRADAVSCHYVDSWGFKKLPAFLKSDNPLKNAEMSMEDDYGMIDGIVNNGPKQPTVAELEADVKAGKAISLLDLANAVKDERRKERPSVMEQLKTQPSQRDHHKAAPKKSAEREL